MTFGVSKCGSEQIAGLQRSTRTATVELPLRLEEEESTVDRPSSYPSRLARILLQKKEVDTRIRGG